MSTENSFTFYQHLYSLVSFGSYNKYIIDNDNQAISSQFKVSLSSLDKLTSYTILFYTREFNKEAYEMLEGSRIKSKFESFLDDSMTDDEYHRLLSFISAVNNNGK